MRILNKRNRWLSDSKSLPNAMRFSKYSIFDTARLLQTFLNPKNSCLFIRHLAFL
jgi:hypothetical protein